MDCIQELEGKGTWFSRLKGICFEAFSDHNLEILQKWVAIVTIVLQSHNLPKNPLLGVVA